MKKMGQTLFIIAMVLKTKKKHLKKDQLREVGLPLSGPKVSFPVADLGPGGEVSLGGFSLSPQERLQPPSAGSTHLFRAYPN